MSDGNDRHVTHEELNALFDRLQEDIEKNRLRKVETRADAHERVLSKLVDANRRMLTLVDKHTDQLSELQR